MKRRRNFDPLPQWGSATNECGKIAHTSRKQARKHIANLHQPGMREFRCERCDLWHVGHLPDRVRQGDSTRDEHYERRRDGQT